MSSKAIPLHSRFQIGNRLRPTGCVHWVACGEGAPCQQVRLRDDGVIAKAMTHPRRRARGEGVPCYGQKVRLRGDDVSAKARTHPPERACRPVFLLSHTQDHSLPIAPSSLTHPVPFIQKVPGPAASTAAVDRPAVETAAVNGLTAAATVIDRTAG